jgi:integrase
VRDRSPGDERLDQEPDATALLVELCDRLPLALQIVAALLADESARPVSELVSELAEEEHRLDSMHYDERLSVRAALTLSYRRLPDDLSRLFRLMSVVPGGDVGRDAARWLINEEVRPQLMASVRAHLVQQHVRDRWSMHDLVRLYSAEEGVTDPVDADNAYRSVVSHYLLAVGAAAEYVTAVVSDAGRRIFKSPDAAARRMEEERPTAIAIVMSAARRPEYYNIAAHFGVILGDLLKAERQLLNDFHNVAAVTASNATQLDDKRMAVCTLNNYGSALRLRGELVKAREVLEEAVRINEANGDVGGASVLRQVLAMAVEDKRLSRNPYAGVKAPRREHRRRGYLTHDQVELLASAVGKYGTVVRFLAYTGLRWGEMAALRVDSMDMLRRRVNVHHAVAEVKGRSVWSTPKSHERRSVPFPRFLSEELAALIVGRSREDLVFTAPDGGVLRVSTFRPRTFAPAVRRLVATVPGFPTVTLHDVRHTAASLAISGGANPNAVQTMLGHQSAVLTMDTYADLFPDDLELVSAALDKARLAALELTADQLRTGAEQGPDQDSWSGPLNWSDASRGGGIRTHDLFVPNEARYQAAPHPA